MSERTPAELFDRAGRALFGEQYVAPMANALRVGKPKVQQWRDGKSNVPAGVWGELEALALKRGDELDSVVEAIVAMSDARKI